MTTEEITHFLEQLKLLHESITYIIKNASENNTQLNSLTHLMQGAAQTYRDIVKKINQTFKRDNSLILFHQAIRVAVLLLSATHNESNSTVKEIVEPVIKEIDSLEVITLIDEWIFEGIDLINTMFFPKESLEPKLKEDLIILVRLLVFVATKKKVKYNQNNFSISQLTNNEKDNSKLLQRQRKLIEGQFRCSKYLFKRGLYNCRDAKELLSSSATYGNIMQKFLLHTLQEEFTVMRWNASGSSTGLENTLDNLLPASPSSSPSLEENNNNNNNNNNDNDNFYYYAPLSAGWGGGAAVRRGGRRGGAPQRCIARSGPAVELALTLLAALSAGESPGRCDTISDFVDFIGDLVSVCAVVVRPFLTEQLESMQQIQQESLTSLVNFKEGGVAGYEHIGEDIIKYQEYIRDVEEFLHRWDSSTTQVTLPPTSSSQVSTTKEKDFIVSDVKTILTEEVIEKNEEDSNDIKLKMETSSLIEKNNKYQNQNENKEDENKNKLELKWESMAPALSSRLTSSIPLDEEATWTDIVSLLTEVKRFRETEKGSLWNQWVKLRKETMEMASEISRMRQRHDALLEMKQLLCPLNGNSMNELQQEWEGGIGQRIHELQGALGKL